MATLCRMAVVVAIDAGTTGVRSLALSEDGDVVASSYREFTQHFPRPGWVEHDADEIWDAVVATLAETLAAVPDAVAAVGITDQRETVVAWDRRNGRPLHRAIVWQDRRTADRCEALDAAGHLPLVRERTGLVLDPYFSATKIEWLLRQGIATGADVAFGTIDSWLLWKLTGGRVHATDVSNASRTMLMDLQTLDWDDELLDLFGVSRSSLPEIRPSSGRFGVTAPAGPLPAGVPVSGIAGDQQAALFGQACVRPGMAKNTYGTGSFVLLNVGTDRPSPAPGLLSTVAWQLEGSPAVYALEGAVFVTGAAVQWLRDGLGVIRSAAEVGPLAASCNDTGGVYLVPAFTGLGSPWWDPYARGTIVGITRGTGRAELARAAVEAMAFQTRDVVEAMTAATGVGLAELRVDGGASVMDLLLELQADQLGVPVTRAARTETTAVGAATLAGLAEGVWGTVGDLEQVWRADRTCAPSGSRDAADRAHARWLRAVERSRDWARDEAGTA
jgi:glycerol kinase